MSVAFDNPFIVLIVSLFAQWLAAYAGAGAAFVFNAPRFVAWVGPLMSSTLITAVGGHTEAALAIAAVYILGLAAAPFLPETLGKPLRSEEAGSGDAIASLSGTKWALTM
jgi:hypothetical protein